MGLRLTREFVVKDALERKRALRSQLSLLETRKAELERRAEALHRFNGPLLSEIQKLLRTPVCGSCLVKFNVAKKGPSKANICLFDGVSRNRAEVSSERGKRRGARPGGSPQERASSEESRSTPQKKGQGYFPNRSSYFGG